MSYKRLNDLNTLYREQEEELLKSEEEVSSLRSEIAFLRGELSKIASCESWVPGDIVSVARAALQEWPDRREFTSAPNVNTCRTQNRRIE